jgi:hypothetical protein
MSRCTPIGRKRSEPAISGCPAMGSGMRRGRWASPGKKMHGSRRRDPQRRKRYLRLRDRYQRRGKEFGYVDERGIAPIVTRRYAYAPTGQRVYDLRCKSLDYTCLTCQRSVESARAVLSVILRRYAEESLFLRDPSLRSA